MNERKSFLQQVMSHIRSKEAKKLVAMELDYHMEEAIKDWREKGLSEEEAEKRAVKQMGNPDTLGMKLNKLHRPKIDWNLLLLFALAIGLGFLPAVIAQHTGYSSGYSFFYNKIKVITVGAVIVILFMLFDYRKVKSYGWIFYGIGCLILILAGMVSLNVFGTTINGWPYFVLGPFLLNTSITLPFFYIAWACFFQNEKIKLWMLAIQFFISFALLVQVSNLSFIVMYSLMVFIMFIWKVRKEKKVLLFTGMVAMGLSMVGFLIVLTNSAQKARFLGFLNPHKYREAAGYLNLQIEKIMSQAGWFGHALPKKDPIVIEPYTDLVFVTLTYVYGWLFSIALVVILAGFLFRIVQICKKIHDPFGQQIIIGGLTIYAVPLVYNILMTIGLLPIAGFSLPFISYGFTPVFTFSIVIGAILSVYRRKDLIQSNVNL